MLFKMKVLIKVLHWIVVIIAIVIILSIDSSVAQSQQLDKLDLMQNPVQDSNDGSIDVVKTLFVILILVVGYLLSLGISNVIKRLESSSEVEKELHHAVTQLTGEMKFQRQKNNQYEIEIAILKKRQNRTDNRINHHEIEIAKLKQHVK